MNSTRREKSSILQQRPAIVGPIETWRNEWSLPYTRSSQKEGLPLQLP
jgi:hypothetical protein